MSSGHLVQLAELWMQVHSNHDGHTRACGAAAQHHLILQERDMQIGIVDKIAAHDQVEGAEKHSMKLAPLPAKCMREMREM